MSTERPTEQMTDFAATDYFTDGATAQDPYAYWEYLREQGRCV